MRQQFRNLHAICLLLPSCNVSIGRSVQFAFTVSRGLRSQFPFTEQEDLRKQDARLACSLAV
jgi:hypothetical protein